jgi:signal transduction histidine kinase
LGDLERWFRTFFESFPDAILLVDRDGTIVAANPAAPADARGRRLTELGREPIARSAPFAVDQQSLTLVRLGRRAADQALDGDFLSVLTHELRTPLQAILGWTQLLGSARDAETSERLLGAIERNVHWQAQVVDDLLDLYRISAGTLNVELRAASAAAIVDSAIARIAPAADAKGVRLTRRFASDRDDVQADPDRLAEAVRRLLFDALRFTAGGGEIEIRLDRVGAAVRIAITDGGDDDDPASSHASGWFRRSQSPATDFGPFGVGLSIVQHVVEMHGGRVGAEHAGPGRGATFFLTLPLSGGL